MAQLVTIKVGSGGRDEIVTASCALPVSDVGSDDWRAAAAEVVRATLHRTGSGGTTVVASLPGTRVRYCRMRLAPVPDAEIPSVVFWRTARELSWDPRDLRTDFYDVGTVDEFGQQLRELIVVAASLADLEAHVAVLQDAALEPVAIDTVPGAIARCLGGADPSDPAESHFVVTLNPTSWALFVARRGSPSFIHTVPRADSGDPGEVRVETIGEEVAHEINLCLHHLGEVGPPHTVPMRGCIVGAGRSEQAIIEVVNRTARVPFEPLVDALLPEIRALVATLPADATVDAWIRPLGLALYERDDLARRAS